MKKVALISSFCDTQEKLNILNKNINIIKNLNIDVILISPIFLPESTTSLCDYYFQTKDNPVLDWPIKSMYSWKEISIKNIKYKIAGTCGDYGWAGLYQVKQLSEIALLFDYEQFFHMIYDLKIDENVLEGFNSEKICNVYPSKRDNNIWVVGLHFIIFNRNNLKRFISNIHLDSYLSLKGADAFVWLHNLQTILPYKNESIPVEDEIYYYQGQDFFNHSPIDDLPFFIIKNDETLESIKLLFYPLKNKTAIKIIVGNKIIEEYITDYKIIDLGFNKLLPTEVKIIFKGIEYNFTKIVNKIKHTTFTVKN
jgi:hypothetical protein